MSVFWILIYGFLRILQANFNKQTSAFMISKWWFYRYGAYFEFAAAFFSFVYVCFLGFNNINGITIICSLITAACFAGELITSLEAMKRAPLVLCNICSMGGGIVFVSIIAIYFFQEPMTLLQWLGVVIFFLAVYFLSDNNTENRQNVQINKKTGLILILNFFINGVCGVVGKYFAVKVANGNAPLYSFTTYLFSSLFFALLLLDYIKKHKSTTAEPVTLKALVLPKKLYIYGAALGATCSTIVILSTILSRTIPVVILNTVPSVISIIGCLIIGTLLFHEKITTKKTIGVILGITSLFMIVR